MLKEKNAEVAQRVHENNTKRILRTLEILEVNNNVVAQDFKKETESPYNYVIIALASARNDLYERINARVDDMFKNGLVEEAKFLYENKLFGAQSKEAIGYKQLIEYFEGKTTLSDAKEEIKKLSRNYAKRQLTFFKGMRKVNWFNYPKDYKNIIELVTEFLK